MVKARQISKLEKMKTCNMKIQSLYPPVEATVNISKRQLRTPEKSVLNKGLKFVTTIKRISYLDLLAPIEGAAFPGKGWWAKMESETSTWEMVWFVGFYGKSNFVGYLTPNPFLCK